MEPRADDAAAWARRGKEYAAHHDYEQAIADFDRAIRIGQNDVETYYQRGLAHAAVGYDDRALADYDKAIELAPDLAAPYLSRGELQARRGEWDRAMADYDRSIQLRPDDAQAYASRAFAHSRARVGWTRRWPIASEPCSCSPTWRRLLSCAGSSTSKRETRRGRSPIFNRPCGSPATQRRAPWCSRCWKRWVPRADGNPKGLFKEHHRHLSAHLEPGTVALGGSAEKYIQIVEHQGYCPHVWGCGVTRRIVPGDRVFLIMGPFVPLVSLW